MLTRTILLGLAAIATIASSSHAQNVTVISDAELTQLRQAAQLTQLAYCVSYPNFRSFDCPICGPPAAGGLTCIQPLISDDKSDQGYVAVDRVTKQVVLAFQGATKIENWAAAFAFPRVKFDVKGADKDAAVHVGFYNAYKSFRSYLLGNVTAALRANPDYGLHAVGHSYGAVIATLFVADLLLTSPTKPPSTRLTLFGSPRLGNYEFARLVDTTLGVRVVRVVHSTDRITRVPPTPTGYRHTGTEVWVDVAGQRVVRCGGVVKGLDESPECVNSVGFFSLGIDAHNSYWDRLAETVCAPRGAQEVVERFLPLETLKKRT
ncbi:hypothetical protein HDU96_007802 [Phlyctochytrium bullatum]|nr:hypothetical protein HDU96_007802 [Phlyctochytrium bullatum]